MTETKPGIATTKVSFPPTRNPPEGSQRGPHLSYTHHDKRGEEWTWTFADVKEPGIARDLATHFGPIAADYFDGVSRSRVQQCDAVWRKFCRHLREQSPDHRIKGLKSVTAGDIDAYDLPGRYNSLADIINVMRAINEVASYVFSTDTRARLNYISKHQAKISKPREPLPDFLCKQLRMKCGERIIQARDRVFDGLKYYEHLQTRGDLNASETIYLQMAQGSKYTSREKSIIRYAGNKYSYWNEVIASVAPTINDAISFIFALGLRVEMPIECIHELRRDCLKNASRGYVDIEYMKGRGGQSAIRKVERVRDGGLNTPGGIVRLALTLTEHAAMQASTYDLKCAEMLWVCAHQRGKKPFRTAAFWSHQITQFIGSLNLIDDAGQPVLAVDSTRLRKTVKVERYRRYGGHLGRFASDHTKAIAVRHYANVEALEEEHKTSVAHAQDRLYQGAMEPLVLTPTEETELPDESDPQDTLIKAVLDGGSDTWLASCLDFWNSPFGAADDGGCQDPFTLCLHCRNAVFTARKLPAVLSYLAWLEERMPIMSLEQWNSLHRRDHVRIASQIVAKFPSDVIADATAKMAASIEASFYVPLHARRV